MRILFILNPTAGGTSKDGWENSIAEYFPAGGDHTHEFFRMEGEDCADACQNAIATFKPDRVGAIGGDGTLKFAAEMLLGTGISIAFLPAGSANGMARELGLSTEPKECLDILVNGTSKAMDAVRLNGHISIHLADLGLNAQLVKYFDEGEGRGMMGYAKQVVRVMRNGHQMRLVISVQGETLKRRAWMLVFANASTYGTGAAINPDGSLYDGHFEIVLLKRRWFWEMVRMLVRKQSTENKRLTEIISAEKATITMRRAAHFQVDGEYIGKVQKVEATVEKGAVMMLVPKETP
jgi:diacylglycerol kinase family enzyme